MHAGLQEEVSGLVELVSVNKWMRSARVCRNQSSLRTPEFTLHIVYSFGLVREPCYLLVSRDNCTADDSNEFNISNKESLRWRQSSFFCSPFSATWLIGKSFANFLLCHMQVFRPYGASVKIFVAAHYLAVHQAHQRLVHMSG